MNFGQIDIYEIRYVEGESHYGGAFTAKSIENDAERGIGTIYVNPNEKDIGKNLSVLIDSGKSVESRTLSIDYRVLTDEIIAVLTAAYLKGSVNGIRLIPTGATLTKEVYEKFNRPELKGFFIAADSVSKEINKNASIISVIEQKRVCNVEKTTYTTTINDKKSTVTNKNIHITKQLTNKEIETLVEIIREQKDFNCIIVDFYEPSYYKELINILNKLSIPKNIKIRFLANPLYDELSIYENLEKISKNEIEIFYNSCNDLNNMYRFGVHSEGEYYYSDIEASGKTKIETYKRMLKMIDEIVEHMEEKGYSPLEKIAYIYDYFKKHYKYNENFENEEHSENAHLHKVFAKDEMICEGFSNLLSVILRRAGVLGFTYGTDNHQKNIVRVKDEKYGVDSIALLDITFDLNGEDNRNNFNNFLVNMSNDLYCPYPSVIDIPTSFFITQDEYNKHIIESNPVYATDPLGYGIRMLQLMGLSHDPNKVRSHEIPDFYRDALLNSSLTETIPIETIADAVTSVRNSEGEYGYYGVAKGVKDRERIVNDTKYREYQRVLPTIKTLVRKNIQTGKIIPSETIILKGYSPKTNAKFMEIPAQNTQLSRPRKKTQNESQEQYDEYLHQFYTNKFIISGKDFQEQMGSDELEEIPEEEIVNAVDESLDRIVEEEKAAVKTKVPTVSPTNEGLNAEDISSAVNANLDSIANNIVPETSEGISEDALNEALSEKLDSILEGLDKPELTSDEIASAIDENLDSIITEDKKPVDAEVVPTDFTTIPETPTEGLTSDEIANAVDENLDSIIAGDKKPVDAEVVPTEFTTIPETPTEELTSDEIANAVSDSLDSIIDNNKKNVSEPVETPTEESSFEGLPEDQISAALLEKLDAMLAAMEPETKNDTISQAVPTEFTTIKDVPSTGLTDEEISAAVSDSLDSIIEDKKPVSANEETPYEGLPEDQINAALLEKLNSILATMEPKTSAEEITAVVPTEPIENDEDTTVGLTDEEIGNAISENLDSILDTPTKDSSDESIVPEEPITETEEPVIPVEETATEIEEPVVPIEETATEIEEPVVPVEETATEIEEPVVPAEETATEIEEPVVPAEETATEIEEPVIPVEETATEIEEPVIPVEETATETEEQVIPVEETSTEIEEPVIPVEETATEIEEPVIPEERTGYRPMTAKEIEAARRNIEADKYEDLYSRDKDEFIPGTDVLNPRNKYEGESDEDYTNYLRDYLDHYFTVDQPNEFIPGTNVLKPRNRGLYESEEDYEKYLKMYYEHCFNKEENESSDKDNSDYETVTLYVDENTDLFYVRSYVASRYDLHSASFPAKIDGALCYRISREDAKRLVEGGESNITPYRVEMELFQRVHERTDEEYNSFDRPKR